MKHIEFNQLITGLNGDTPLGYTVQVRAETDHKKIREMTAHDKKIRQEWKQFRSKQQKQDVIVLSKDDIDKAFTSMFR
jgi:hypothetical protein